MAICAEIAAWLVFQLEIADSIKRANTRCHTSLVLRSRQK